jgi:hypothetical protein
MDTKRIFLVYENKLHFNSSEISLECAKVKK